MGKQEILTSTPNGELGSNIQLQLDSFVYNLNMSYTCTRVTATIFDIDQTMNGLELTCATAQCRSIFSSTFMVKVIGKQS